MSSRLAVAIALTAAALSLLLFATSYGDPPETLVDAAPAVLVPCEPLPNPCDEIDCERSRPTRSDLA